MSATTPCVPCCSTPITTNVPGPVGPNGTPGTNGTNGINAFTFTTGNFVVPALGSNVTVNVGISSWAAVGQAVYISNGTATADIYSVASVPSSTSLTLTYLNYTTNTNTGNTVNSGAEVSPGGFQSLPPLPLAIASGGTNANTKAGAQNNLGLGQDSTQSNVSALAQAITGTPTQVGTLGVTIPASGHYLILCRVNINWANWIANTTAHVLTLTLKNTVQNTTVASLTWSVQNAGLIPDSDLNLPITLYTTGVVADTLVVNISISNIGTNSSGTANVQAGTLSLIPLHLT